MHVYTPLMVASFRGAAHRVRSACVLLGWSCWFEVELGGEVVDVLEVGGVGRSSLLGEASMR